MNQQLVTISKRTRRLKQQATSYISFKDTRKLVVYECQIHRNSSTINYLISMTNPLW